MSDDGVLCDPEHAFDSDQGMMMNLLEHSKSSPGEGILNDIENMLMNDDDLIDEDGVNRSYFVDILSDVLLDAPADAELFTPSDRKSSPQSHVSDSIAKNTTNADDDPDSKKRKRQLRNKDAALRSRERKKMYVKDLEIKSRYLEGECRKLGRLLQSCYAENQDLRFRLHMGNGAVGAPVTKQESAVLLLESLLLGSLFWFLGIMCLFHLPKQLRSNQEAVVLQGIIKSDPRSVQRRRAKNNLIESQRFRTLDSNRRCRALRIKMKPLCRYIPTSIVSVLV